jgi:hypothetical protein
LPILTEGGVDIKGGRFYSPAGYVSVPIINRQFISVPYSYNFTPFTFFGALSTLHLTDRVTILNGTINGFDRWVDRNYKWGYIGGVNWESRDKKTTLSLIGITAPDQLPRFAPLDTPIIPTATTPVGIFPGRINPFYASSFRGYISTYLTHQWTEKLSQVV